jgi:hypothetical protein
VNSKLTIAPVRKYANLYIFYVDFDSSFSQDRLIRRTLGI